MCVAGLLLQFADALVQVFDRTVDDRVAFELVDAPLELLKCVIGRTIVLKNFDFVVNPLVVGVLEVETAANRLKLLFDAGI